MSASDVKRGDRVVFVTGGKQFNGIALRDAKVSVHPGVKSAHIHLDLVYVLADGVVVRVLHAQVLLTAIDSDDLTKLVALDKDFQSQKQVQGWKPFEDSEEVAALKEQLAAATVEANDGKAAMNEVNNLTAERAGLESAVLGLQTQLESVTTERDALKEELAKSESEKAELQQRLTSAAEVALSETPLVEAGLAAGAKPDTTVDSSEGAERQVTEGE